ncbi:MAG: ATP synthase subunit I [Polynucleobacter sp.]|nr:ATP synthase subunit I [Polynucleobacter sp.]
MKAPTNQPNAEDPWKEPEEPFRVYSGEEMQALLQTRSGKNRWSLPWGVVAVQILATALGAFISCVFWDEGRISVYTYSAFLGGVIGVVPAVLFLLRLEIARGAQRLTPGGFLSALVSGEVIKITATIALFVWLAFNYAELKWIPLLLTYVVTLKCYLIGLFWR